MKELKFLDTGDGGFCVHYGEKHLGLLKCGSGSCTGAYTLEYEDGGELRSVPFVAQDDTAARAETTRMLADTVAALAAAEAKNVDVLPLSELLRYVVSTLSGLAALCAVTKRYDEYTEVVVSHLASTVCSDESLTPEARELRVQQLSKMLAERVEKGMAIVAAEEARRKQIGQLIAEVMRIGDDEPPEQTPGNHVH